MKELQIQLPTVVRDFIVARAEAQGMSASAFARQMIVSQYPWKDDYGRCIPKPDGVRVTDPPLLVTAGDTVRIPLDLRPDAEARTLDIFERNEEQKKALRRAQKRKAPAGRTAKKSAKKAGRK